MLIKTDKKYTLKVERFYVSDQIERYRITGGNRSIELQTNRPYLKARGRKKHYTWKLISGEMTYASTLETIISTLESEIHHFENPPVKYVHPKDANHNTFYNSRTGKIEPKK